MYTVTLSHLKLVTDIQPHVPSFQVLMASSALERRYALSVFFLNLFFFSSKFQRFQDLVDCVTTSYCIKFNTDDDVK